MNWTNPRGCANKEDGLLAANTEVRNVTVERPWRRHWWWRHTRWIIQTVAAHSTLASTYTEIFTKPAIRCQHTHMIRYSSTTTISTSITVSTNSQTAPFGSYYVILIRNKCLVQSTIFLSTLGKYNRNKNKIIQQDQVDIVWGLWSQFLISLLMQDYKALCPAFMISNTLVDTHTDRETPKSDRQRQMPINPHYMINLTELWPAKLIKNWESTSFTSQFKNEILRSQSSSNSNQRTSNTLVTRPICNWNRHADKQKSTYLSRCIPGQFFNRSVTPGNSRWQNGIAFELASCHDPWTLTDQSQTI